MGFLFLVVYSGRVRLPYSHTPAQLSHTHNSHTYNLLTHNSYTHTKLTHTQLTRTQLTHRQLTHTQLIHTHTYNLLIHNSYTHTQLTHTHKPSLCVAGVALLALGWLWWRAWVPWSPLLFALQAWHLVTSTCILRGRRGTYGTGMALVVRLGPVIAVAVCVTGVALGDIDLHSAWQAWHMATSTYILRGRRHLATSTCILRGKRVTSRHRRAFCVAGMAPTR